MNTDRLVQQYPIISEQIEKQELKVILRELSGVLDKKVEGDVVEFGCYIGTTSLFLQRMITNDKRKLYVYDSFQGLPDKSTHDQSPVGQQFEAGKLAATKQELIRNFKKAGLPLPHVTKGWFTDMRTDDVPAVIAFAFLDGDYYDSVLYPLKLIWPHLSRGAVVVIDDYQNEALPGASKAVDAWLTSHSVKSFKVEQSLAIIST